LKEEELTPSSGLLPTTHSGEYHQDDWRPVYYASSPLDAAACHVLAVPPRFNKTLLDVSVDGPYGLPHAELVKRKHRVLFVASGASVAPCASTLRSLALQDFGEPRPTRARLVWTVENAAMLDVFADTLDLARLLEAPPSAPFSATASLESCDFELEHNMLSSPPDLLAECAALVAGLDDAYDALVFASGSDALVRDARRAALHVGAAFRTAPTHF